MAGVLAEPDQLLLAAKILGFGASRIPPRRCGERSPARRSSNSLFAGARNGPRRSGGRPPQARPQLLGHDLDHRPGAAVLSGPGPRLEPTADHHPAAPGQRLSRVLGPQVATVWDPSVADWPSAREGTLVLAGEGTARKWSR